MSHLTPHAAKMLRKSLINRDEEEALRFAKNFVKASLNLESDEEAEEAVVDFMLAEGLEVCSHCGKIGDELYAMEGGEGRMFCSYTCEGCKNGN